MRYFEPSDVRSPIVCVKTTTIRCLDENYSTMIHEGIVFTEARVVATQNRRRKVRERGGFSQHCCSESAMTALPGRPASGFGHRVSPSSTRLALSACHLATCAVSASVGESRTRPPRCRRLSHSLHPSVFFSQLGYWVFTVGLQDSDVSAQKAKLGHLRARLG